MDALIEISLGKENQLSIVNRRVEAEQKKKTKNSTKLSQFTADQKELNQQLGSTQTFISMIFEQYAFYF
jgi:hypothetical protein